MGNSGFGRMLIDLIEDLRRVEVLWQIAIIALAVLIAWQVSRRLRHRLLAAMGTTDAVNAGMESAYRVLFPLATLLLLLLARYLLKPHLSVHLLNIAIPLTLAMVIIRAAVYLLQHSFSGGTVQRSSEVAISWVVWLGVASHVLGVLPAIAGFLDDTAIRIGQQRLSLAMLLTGALTVALTVLIALWLGRMIEGRVMRLQHVEINMRFALTKIVRSVLVVVSVLIALPLVGIDITVLSVFGGALGVGIGFGLQKVAANYVSGFTILLDRTVSPGDFVTVDGYFGEVTRLTSRCIIVRGGDGTEAIVPNETVITSKVINYSYSNRRALVRVPVQVSYESDLEATLKLMLDAAAMHARVLKDPAPSVQVLSFGDNGINLQLAAWMQDLEAGQGSLVSDLNLALYRSFAANGIEIPFPRRDIRILDKVEAAKTDPI